ncbi:MAG: hypothetical protein KAT43_06510 [Nanoarchaeota archaeon]|nr:hypothetical protein [Nanoarchaeota archaeon]
MGRSIVYICVEDEEVRNIVDKMGDVVRPEELKDIEKMMFTHLDMAYCPTISCDEGSPKDKELRVNDGMFNGHHYSVVKELNFDR